MSGSYLSSSSGHVVVTGASRCDLDPLRRGKKADGKHVCRPIKLQMHNVTAIRFGVPDVVLWARDWRLSLRRWPRLQSPISQPVIDSIRS